MKPFHKLSCSRPAIGAVLLSALAWASGCHKPDETLGLDVLPSDVALGTVVVDTSRIVAWTIRPVPGKTSGLSNIPWHQDCGLGGHGIICPAVGIGIQFTGSSAETGNLQVIPGSHGQAVHYRWMQRLEDLPYVSIDTEPGDVTIHIQDVMHASPQPTGAGGRRTMYVPYYPEALWEHVGPGEAYNDLVRNRTEQVARLQ